MPWQSEAKKDVIHCEKLRGAVNKHWSADVWMGKPGRKVIVTWIHSVAKRTWGTETSKYLQERKSTETLKVAASEIGPAERHSVKNWKHLGRCTVGGDSPVQVDNVVLLSRAGHEKSCLNMGRPLSKAKYYWLTDSEQVPWGKGEKHPDKGSEREPETGCLQAVEGALSSDGVPFV